MFLCADLFDLVTFEQNQDDDIEKLSDVQSDSKGGKCIKGLLHLYFLFPLFLAFLIIIISVTLEEPQFFKQIGEMGDSILLYFDECPSYSEPESMINKGDEKVLWSGAESQNQTYGKNINNLSIFVSIFFKSI